MKASYNILMEPIFRVSLDGGQEVTCSLPKVYEALLKNQVVGFRSLRPHQRHAWHSFLAQLGATALHEAGLNTPPTAAAAWVELLRNLTMDYPDDDPWCLVVEDMALPAFMQPPLTDDATPGDYNKTVVSPDEIDILVMSKNHEVKVKSSHSNTLDDWVFALLTLQTMGGYSGPRHYGISRMNTGFGNRPCFSLAPSVSQAGVIRPGPHVKRDMLVLNDHWDEIADEYQLNKDGISLMWTVPWGGEKSEKIEFAQLAPCYIEVCRRVRLQETRPCELQAVVSTSKDSRVNAKRLSGNTGDGWTPIHKEGAKALTLSAGGFTYERIVEYLDDQVWRWPVLLHASEHDSEHSALVSRAMVRGRGKTEGYHERVIPIDPATRDMMGSAEGRRRLSQIASERVEAIAKLQNILRFALIIFSGGGKNRNSQEHRQRAKSWAKRLDLVAERTFFHDLQMEAVADEDRRPDIRKKWLLDRLSGDGLINESRRILRQAQATLPCRGESRDKAIAESQRQFEFDIRRSDSGFPDIFERESKEKK